ncbi:MAG: exonuclease SbcCD subunit D [Clostridiales bacterium]|nr:exonuclease SbcCD subunit D [Clostridiales bacterium]
MKLMHLADLHLGKRYNELSLIDDQKYILGEILKIASEVAPDGVILAGDIYDKSVPSAEAVELFDWFLNGLAELNLQVFIVSGNHDSPERIAFGERFMGRSGVHISPVFDGKIKRVKLTDKHGGVHVYLLPFVKPATVRRFFENENIDSYTAAVKAALGTVGLDGNARNILVAHQFVTGSKSSGSEEFTVGDIGNVDAGVFDGFDYVALGHVHGAQNVAGERVRYSGTPLVYSLSEAAGEKSVTLVELGEKGDLKISEIPLKPMRNVVEIRGTYDELTRRDYYENTTLPDDLVHVVLTDEEEVPDALGKLRIIYPFVMSLRYDNRRTREQAKLQLDDGVPARTPFELFSALYEAQNNAAMSDEQSEFVRALIEKVWGEEQ